MKLLSNKLVKLIKENPNLDIICKCCEDDLCEGFYTCIEVKSVSIKDIYEYDGVIYDDVDDVECILIDNNSDNEEWANLSDEEYEKLVKELAKECFIKKAIVIMTSGI